MPKGEPLDGCKEVMMIKLLEANPSHSRAATENMCSASSGACVSPSLRRYCSPPGRAAAIPLAGAGKGKGHKDAATTHACGPPSPCKVVVGEAGNEKAGGRTARIDT